MQEPQESAQNAAASTTTTVEPTTTTTEPTNAEQAQTLIDLLNKKLPEAKILDNLTACHANLSLLERLHFEDATSVSDEALTQQRNAFNVVLKTYITETLIPYIEGTLPGLTTLTQLVGSPLLETLLDISRILSKNEALKNEFKNPQQLHAAINLFLQETASETDETLQALYNAMRLVTTKFNELSKRNAELIAAERERVTAELRRLREQQAATIPLPEEETLPSQEPRKSDVKTFISEALALTRAYLSRKSFSNFLPVFRKNSAKDAPLSFSQRFSNFRANVIHFASALVSHIKVLFKKAFFKNYTHSENENQNSRFEARKFNIDFSKEATISLGELENEKSPTWEHVQQKFLDIQGGLNDSSRMKSFIGEAAYNALNTLGRTRETEEPLFHHANPLTFYEQRNQKPGRVVVSEGIRALFNEHIDNATQTFRK